MFGVDQQGTRLIVVMTFGYDWVVIYVNSLARGIMVTRLI